MLGEPGAGPDVVIVGGLHGNEPEGLIAGQAVLEALRGVEAMLPGRVVLLAGNQAALRLSRRFLERDLNRGWREDAISRVRLRHQHERSREDREQLDLIACVETLGRDADQGVVLIDLHTTSAGAPPFSVIIDTPTNRHLAESVGLPVVLGFEEQVDSPILTWWHDQGWPGLGIEGGSRGDEAAPVHLASAIWRVMGALGWPLPEAVVADEPGRAYRIVYRHAVVPGAGFRMDPGYESFQAVREGQRLAQDCTGPIRSMCEGLIFMPLYQAQGSDGFFLLAPAG